MAKYVLVSDFTLVYNYRNFPLLDFLPCAPSDAIPRAAYNYLKGSPTPALPNGQAAYAPYSIRKLEAALIAHNPADDIAVPHPDFIEDFIDEDTEVIGVSTMDPLGLGPLTMSYSVLFSSDSSPWIRNEWYDLMARLNRARKGKKAKLLVGGPGVWEFTMLPEEFSKSGADYAFQGEADDIAHLLFSQIAQGKLDHNIFYEGYMSFDENFRRFYRPDSRFISRRPGGRSAPTLDEIPLIMKPTMKGLSEIMRGCGIGCDFCEVTLRPLRYYSPEHVAQEVLVNAEAGQTNAWLHTDEVFAYKHGPLYQPNEEALVELFKAVMNVPGIITTNPTHGRISIPAAFPDLIAKLSEIMKAGPSNWIGIQVGIETGSDRLAKIHMPNKTLPLRVGSDGSWAQIVYDGTRNFNEHFWRPAFTVQVGQDEELPEDNWDTVALINKMSCAEVEGRPFEFTATPMQHVPLGVLRSRRFSHEMLTESQLAVYYASYRHLAKMASRDAMRDSHGNPFARLATAGMIRFGGWVMMKYVEKICKDRGLDIDKVKRYGI
ncbi:MAG: B12-binding domain-containing radical SAM protein [Candidatus Marsarchaeota archaeon]|nr:B12-binding domain-containing radical SAM protein [Candidatus Marsarchaeota archaeon]